MPQKVSNFERVGKTQLGRNLYLVVSRRSDQQFSFAKMSKVESEEGEEEMFKANSLIFTAGQLFSLLEVTMAAIATLRPDEVPEEKTDLNEKVKQVVATVA